MCEYINGAIIQEDFTMETTIYDESNGLWYKLRGRLLHPLPGSTGSRRTAYRHLGTAAPSVHQEGAQSPVHGTADQRQAEYISCRHQRTGNGTNAPADRANGRA